MLNINSPAVQSEKIVLFFCRTLWLNAAKFRIKDVQMADFAVFARQLAQDAGALLAGRFSKRHEVEYKGTIDLVTEADRLSEALMVERIRSRFPDHGIITEESPALNEAAGLRWIIDPLDGTTNYAHGNPVFCVSVALEKEGKIVLGVVYDPMRGDLFFARRGNGATLNGRALCVSKVSDLSRSLLATGFPYDIRESPENNLDFFGAMAVQAQAIRRAGAAALDLAYLAAGRFDGFWELKLKPWDTAAGCLLVSEAGGRVTEMDGGSWRIDSAGLAASNGLIHEPMLEVFQAVKKMRL